jgi:hypothetical protein
MGAQKTHGFNRGEDVTRIPTPTNRPSTVCLEYIVVKYISIRYNKCGAGVQDDKGY